MSNEMALDADAILNTAKRHLKDLHEIVGSLQIAQPLKQFMYERISYIISDIERAQENLLI